MNRKANNMISVVMLSFKRPENLKLIVQKLRKNVLVDDIVIWHNNADEPPPFFNAVDRVKLIVSNYDVGMNSRWYASLLTKHDAILMQDDDLILSDSAIKTLYEKWKKDQEVIHGIWGGIPDKMHNYNFGRAYPNAEWVLTRAMLFHKKYIYEILRKIKEISQGIRNIIDKNGEDIFFSYMVMGITKRKNKTYRLSKQVMGLPSHFSISLRPEHVVQRTKIIKVCRKKFGINNFR